MLEVKASVPDGKPTIALEREFDAPPAVVFEAFSDQAALTAWWGPNGFTLEFHEMDFRIGGQARFDMTGPDGTVYPNRLAYREIVPGSRIAYLHDSGVDNDPHGFEVTVSFAPLAGQRTLLTMTSVFPSVEARNAVLTFGAVELGKQTVEKLAAYLAA